MTEDDRLLWAQRELGDATAAMEETREAFLAACRPTAAMEEAREAFRAACRRHEEALQATITLDPKTASDGSRLEEVKCSGCGEIVLSKYRSSPTCKLLVWCSKCQPTLDSPDATRRLRESAR